MASNSIERMLELNSKIEKSVGQPPTGPRRVTTQNDLDRLINQYDNQVYGPSMENPNDTPKKYDARAEMEHLKEIEAQGGRSAVNLEGRNIPRSIVESILNNPLDLKPVVDTRMDELESKIASKGIKTALEVMNKVDKRDAERKEKVFEEVIERSNNGTANIDYSLIKTIVNECINDKLGGITKALNESKGAQQNVPSMKLLSFKDNFYFVDNDDNVYECVMKYKGKRKKR